MYVVKVEDFLQMTEALPHQTLLAVGVATRACSSTVNVFVSHQWCGGSHPDPRFEQLRILQVVFERASKGLLSVDADPSNLSLKSASVRPSDLMEAKSWSIWFDYFSVPQPEAAQFQPAQHMNLTTELGKAVASLAKYVEACRLFFVLAPNVRGDDGQLVDYASWKQRGWCRFERLARNLSAGPSSVIIVRRTDAVFEVGAADSLVYPVGLGSFSVEADRARLGPIVRGLLARSIGQLSDIGDLDSARHLTAW